MSRYKRKYCFRVLNVLLKTKEKEKRMATKQTFEEVSQFDVSFFP